jgi:hypothetical protein
LRPGWQLLLFWLGENLLNISVYTGDPFYRNLPAGGGDWAYLLTKTGLIMHTHGVSQALFAAGSAVIFLSLYFIARDALTRESIEFGGGRSFPGFRI